MNENGSPQKNKRLAFLISGAMDAVIGAVIILIGFGFFPIDVTDYGFENWHAFVLGGVLLFIGVVTFAYHFSRMNE